jgi:hypothetical protein
MERNNSNEWINSLKIAIINENLKKIEEYSNREIPEFSSIEEAKEALALVNEAKNILQKKKAFIKQQMQEIKQQNRYANSYENHTNEWNV